MSKVKIVCPNPAMIPIAVEGSIPLEKMYENLWIVDEQAYETCVIETTKPQNRILMKCDSPLQLRYFTVVFQRYSAVGADGLEFEPGKEYYFIGKQSYIALLFFKKKINNAPFRATHLIPTPQGFEVDRVERINDGKSQ